MQRLGLAMVGLILVAVGLVGTRHGVRAGQAQSLYFRSKYGDWKDSPARIMAAAEQAHQLYPHNDELCIWAAETAYNRRFDGGVESPVLLAAAATWTRRGLELNPYARPLRVLDVRMTERRSLPEAIRRWEEFVDWQYWEPGNHALLVELYARAGRYREALASLAVIKGRPYHAEAKRWIAHAWQAEIADMRARQSQGR
ncbi:MAG: hypothetical protein K8T26_01960 [Lentisphaerae bacterium]|nr:hypothetical protein [Lentisphaerota bacterium]